MSEEIKKELENEEIVQEEPMIEEPSKDIKIGDIDITLINEMIQTINDEVNVTFTSEAGMDALKNAFETCGLFAYGEDTYEGYSIVKSFEFEVDNTGQEVYRVTVSKPEEEVELTADQTYAITFAVMSMPDADAVQHMTIFPEWAIGMDYKVGDRVQSDEKLWKCRQQHTSQENWKPGIDTASLWEVIDVEHAGTYDDPIPYDQTMTVYNGKYYIENDIIYKCIRDSGQALYASCASLVNNYFEIAEEE